MDEKHTIAVLGRHFSRGQLPNGKRGGDEDDRYANNLYALMDAAEELAQPLRDHPVAWTARH